MMMSQRCKTILGVSLRISRLHPYKGKGELDDSLFPDMDEALKFLEDMTISQPQLPIAYHKLSLNPPVVDGMINLVPPSISSVDQVFNLVTSRCSSDVDR
jgi:hypothetical protein